MSRASISVVTPCYNDVEYLPECLESISKQTYKNIEHIVIDGNSTDGTGDLLEEWKNKRDKQTNGISFDYIREDDDTMYEAIEKGFALATGDVYCWLNADDKWLPYTADLVSDVFTKKDAEWITGHPSFLDPNGRMFRTEALRPHFRKEWIKRGWYYGEGLRYIQQESVFWRRELWEKAGGFPDDVELAGDYWLWRQFAEEADLLTVDTVLSSYRGREGGEQLSVPVSEYLAEIDRSPVAELLGKLRINQFYSILLNLTKEPVSSEIKRSHSQ